MAAGVIFTIDGVGGFNISTTAMAMAFKLCGLPQRIEQIYWSHGFGQWLLDLQDSRRMEDKARELAMRIENLYASGVNVYIVAKSAGCAIALKALSLVPADSVQKVILLAPAVSPQYKLQPALRAVKEKLVSFWSPNDAFILGLGTTLFGTADGAYSKSAGMIGFAAPQAIDSEAANLYEKFSQIKWRPSMVATLNFGDHQGSVTLPFLANHVVPLLK
ncbi:MAG: alpha/beta hydrolase [Cyanobacteria bacterium REEB67]|nr:alpha/beta hydrolase [Cyanobacteria bacterium REEB67]